MNARPLGSAARYCPGVPLRHPVSCCHVMLFIFKLLREKEREKVRNNIWQCREDINLTLTKITPTNVYNIIYLHPHDFTNSNQLTSLSKSRTM